MLDYGIRVKNDAGNIQIDGTYRNISYMEGGSGAGSGVTNITSGPLVPFILIKPSTSGFMSPFYFQKTGDNYDGFGLVPELSQTPTVDWKCYRESNSALTGYGIRVKDASGNQVFHSALRYLKIYSIENVEVSAPTYASQGYSYSTVSHAGISDPYYLIKPLGRWYTDSMEVSPPGYYSWYWCLQGIKKVNSTSSYVGWFPFFKPTIPGPPSGVPYGWNPTIKVVICYP